MGPVGPRVGLWQGMRAYASRVGTHSAAHFASRKAAMASMVGEVLGGVLGRREGGGE